MPLRIGMVGCGDIARIHAECLSALGGDNAVIAGGFDTTPHTAESFTRRFGGVAYASAEALAFSPNVDAVYVCTRHDSHPEVIGLAASAEKHIFCEKPLALAFSEAKKAHHLIRRYDKVFMIGYNHRFTPANLALKEVLASRRLMPRVMSLSFVTAPFLHGWPGTREYGGGVVVCLGSHSFDLLRYLAGEEPRSITAKAWRTRLGEPYLEDVAAAWVEFPSGCVATVSFHDQGIYGLQVFPGRNMVRTEVFGEEGCAVAMGLSGLVVWTGGGREDHTFEPYDFNRTWGYLEENRRFLLAVQGAAEPSPGARDAFEAARLVEAALRSCAEQRPVALEEIV